jgi:hypothetical protein
MSGYSKNPATAEALLPILGPLTQGQLCTWDTEEATTSDYLAGKIREALYIARLYKDRYQTYLQEHPEDRIATQMVSLAIMADRVSIVCISPRYVEARFKRGTPEAVVLATSAPPIQGMENAERAVVTMTAQTPWSIQEAWKAQQPSNTPLHFPRANLTYDELVELHTWAEKMNLIIIEFDGAITIQRKTLDLLSFAWHPQAKVEDVPESEFPFKD